MMISAPEHVGAPCDNGHVRMKWAGEGCSPPGPGRTVEEFDVASMPALDDQLLDPHPRWQGHPRHYQRAAQTKYVAETDAHMLPWSWISTGCDQNMCMDVECMIVLSPVKIAYPPYVCVYCGDPAGTVDHLLPRGFSGDTTRRQVAVVPACRECNCHIGATHAVSIRERREVAHRRIAKKHRRLLSAPNRTPREMAEFGPTLRAAIESNNKKRAAIRYRMSWPDDPDYDRRAFERSGIADAAGLGLI